jgi:hypothetical protein
VKVDENTSKQVLPMNPHVSKVTSQVLKIVNNILPVRLQLLKVLEVQPLELQVLNIETLEVQVSKVHILNIKISKVQVLNIHIPKVQILVFQKMAIVHVSED